ncbi:alpha-N-acetylgalactosaminidase [Galendromus occidentalis]|uniref:Alpha-galactosidase n=1 Tax=Galendromus occidentalis TaxID=34638 RepID=A0AAJ6QXW1_9ACAR|nr:alpha-N-acetylgalactosaminidase [Galendromus occidentalis]
MTRSATLVLFPFLIAGAIALENGLARTPPMGWLSWQRYRCITDCKNRPNDCISEGLYKRMADRLIADGYRDVGYEYVNVDDCWSLLERDNVTGRLVADPARFPNGIAALAEYMHDRGLKLGIYGDAGTKTCGGYPGSEGYFDVDAQTFAEWGVDMLKLDGCYLDTDAMADVYPKMTRALNETGRPILYSCSWPAYLIGKKLDYESIQEHCNIWRNFNDIDDAWTSVKSIIDFYKTNQRTFVQVAKPGAFHDPDMLIIGNFGLSLDQARVQMALWAIFASPLLMSNDLEKIGRAEREILLNRHVIAVNQDSDGIMGSMVEKSGDFEVYSRPVRPNRKPSTSRVFAIMNRVEGGAPSPYTLCASDQLGLSSGRGYYVTDLFANNRLIGVLRPGDNLTVEVNPSGVVLLKATLIDADSEQ